MKYIDEYRNPAQAAELTRAIKETATGLGRNLRFMEVCGTHTMAIFRFGLRELLPENIELISGPGCPVCVTAPAEIDRAVELCLKPGVTVATFGDMVRVPGGGMSLARAEAEGGSVKVVYSTFDALAYAKENPDREVVFMGIGFETTSPTVAASVVKARDEGIKNYSVLASFKLLPPALDAILSSNKAKVNGFIMPGHVTTIIGARSYEPVAADYRIPCVVAGFEPTDILASVLMLARDAADGKAHVQVQYRRGAGMRANKPALAVLNQAFEPKDALWRGLGRIKDSGLGLKEEFAGFDAARRFGLPGQDELEIKDPPGCSCGEVLQGLIKPADCPLFRTKCTPRTPVGPCMVSAEGTCAAYFKYHR